MVPIAYVSSSGKRFFSCSITDLPILPPWPSIITIFMYSPSFVLSSAARHYLYMVLRIYFNRNKAESKCYPQFEG
ncbi:hypothetical protein CBFG_06126 [Clostridiales bacterium 1_7_47FAA]|nr:hypothetical protein CBFG_06126 [Clostridiales bacterium 1_7_47FAA]